MRAKYEVPNSENLYNPKKYQTVNNTGLRKWLNDIKHRKISSGVHPALNRKILEIGGGAHPHYKSLQLKGVDSYVVSDLRTVLDSMDSEILPGAGLTAQKHYAEVDPSLLSLSGGESKFTRVIASHVWEHVFDPEQSLLDWTACLEHNGLLSLAIPCDPGYVWRFGQILTRNKVRKHLGFSTAEYDLVMSREHINAVQRLMRIFRFYYPRGKVRKFPFPFMPVEVNLYVFLSATRGQFAV